MHDVPVDGNAGPADAGQDRCHVRGIAPVIVRLKAQRHPAIFRVPCNGRQAPDQEIHGLLAADPGRIALGVPAARQDLLRLFATTPDELHALQAAMARRPWFRDYAQLSAVLDVPADFGGPWAAFARYRIPTVKSDRHAVDGYSALRERRLQQALDRRLDHFRAHSASTGSSFSLTVERIDAPGLPREGVPNSYGLCSRASLFAVPDLPPLAAPP